VDKEAYEGLIIATVMASLKKVTAGLRHAASGEHQDYEPGTLELGVALDGLNMLANDVINTVLSNRENEWEGEIGILDFAAAGFATIANRTDDEHIKDFALENFQAIKGIK
jgi:hypothetical protein